MMMMIMMMIVASAGGVFQGLKLYDALQQPAWLFQDAGLTVAVYGFDDQSVGAKEPKSLLVRLSYITERTARFTSFQKTGESHWVTHSVSAKVRLQSVWPVVVPRATVPKDLFLSESTKFGWMDTLIGEPFDFNRAWWVLRQGFQPANEKNTRCAHENFTWIDLTQSVHTFAKQWLVWKTAAHQSMLILSTLLGGRAEVLSTHTQCHSICILNYVERLHTSVLEVFCLSSQTAEAHVQLGTHKTSTAC